MLPRRRADAAIDAAALATTAGGLRGKARRLRVSHEAVRQAMIAAGLSTGSEDRNSRIRQMAARGVPWRAIAEAFGMSPAGVRFVCRDLPPRKAGRPCNKPDGSLARVTAADPYHP